ncbi:MAG TPA: hypothetical protein VHW90_11530 [Stellaceae bacterium]|jgi:hypothetical protein|nr:hypothetical protein [Stellaceae bacterium]
MRFAAFTLIGSLTLAAAALPANAAPALARADAPTASNVIEVSGGCGPAGHRNPWGYCRPNHYYNYGWYGPYHHHWHHW